MQNVVNTMLESMICCRPDLKTSNSVVLKRFLAKFTSFIQNSSSVMYSTAKVLITGSLPVFMGVFFVGHSVHNCLCFTHAVSLLCEAWTPPCLWGLDSPLSVLPIGHACSLHITAYTLFQPSWFNQGRVQQLTGRIGRTICYVGQVSCWTTG